MTDENLRSIRETLTRVPTSKGKINCTCNIKIPDLKYHREECLFKAIRQSIILITEMINGTDS